MRKHEFERTASEHISADSDAVVLERALPLHQRPLHLLG
jgi:hypothetical protein